VLPLPSKYDKLNYRKGKTMIAFGPPHDPDSPEGIEYAAIQERIRQYRREAAEMRAESERMDAEMQREIDRIGNPTIATLALLAVCAIPAVLMLLLYHAL
jgi:hypothetical protein